ncbi:MAG: helix-turn-helix domain-containing protein [Bacteroidia bacterium]|nr:helix-turn-helix domain-containing protein [Bacteroidia bacterium]
MLERSKRQLAAVMFTDIVGYTALMQADEDKAAKVRAKHRSVFEREHQSHQGEILQYYGDGSLSVFKSAVEAVECAIALQLQLQSGLEVPIRIGIHLGDIVFDKTEVYGDGVNFASRIESMGEAGAILVSDKLNDELKNHAHISTISLGEFSLKNILETVEIFAVSNEGIRIPDIAELKGKGKRKQDMKSIAVLPFVNMSNQEDSEFFSDGITEEIINALAKIEQLKVTSRTSSFYFKNKQIPLSQIAKELKVSTILEGSVRIHRDAIRITAQLIQADEDYHFWSETWDRKLENIFDIQDEISLLIADKLREHFGHFEIMDRLVDRQTQSITAYEYSLRAKYYQNKWNPEDSKKAISLYEKALEIDPQHAQSYVGMADCYSFLGTTGFLPFNEAWKKSHTYTLQAFKLNRQLSDVYYQLGNEAFFIEVDFRKALMNMKQALILNPNNAEAQQIIAYFYIVSGEKEKAREHLDIANRINPLSDENHFWNALYHYTFENYGEALKLLNICLESNDKNIPAHAVKTMALLKMKAFDEIINYYDQVPQEIVVIQEKTGILTLAYALKGDKQKEEEHLELLKTKAKEVVGQTADGYLFMYYANTGQFDKAFEWVENALKGKASMLLLRYGDPLVENLRTDPRYTAYKARIYQLGESLPEEKQKKALLDESQAKHFTELLLKYIETDRPYLDPDLSLRSLAEQLSIHPNQLSWLLNEHLDKNFNDFINHYRVETFKSLLLDPKNSAITIMGLAFESGFNSKTTFNTFFKKETGMTPRQFQKFQQA